MVSQCELSRIFYGAYGYFFNTNYMYIYIENQANPTLRTIHTFHFDFIAKAYTSSFIQWNFGEWELKDKLGGSDFIITEMTRIELSQELFSKIKLFYDQNT